MVERQQNSNRIVVDPRESGTGSRRKATGGAGVVGKKRREE
jgi:hypothetical protein